ncbi:MAG: c-type cytochrome [Bacteroidota bacterium]|nr:c-type cytochrome [Bacteroidota bacterium]
MKAITLIVKQVMKASLVVCFMLFVSQVSFAQAKPKGSPWPAPASAINMKNPVKSDPVSIKDGKQLYIKNCKSCHGESGKGDGTKAGNLDIACGDFTLPAFAKSTDGELYWKITEGRKPMPTFNKKLTDAERWSVVNYIRTLNK